MSKHDQRKYDLTLLKQSVIVAGFMLTAIFSPDIRGSISSQSSITPIISDRVLALEMQNSEHAKMTNQLDNHATIINDLKGAVGELTIQVKALAEMVSDMQDREYARLSSGS